MQSNYAFLHSRRVFPRRAGSRPRLSVRAWLVGFIRRWVPVRRIYRIGEKPLQKAGAFIYLFVVEHITDILISLHFFT